MIDNNVALLKKKKIVNSNGYCCCRYHTVVRLCVMWSVLFFYSSFSSEWMIYGLKMRLKLQEYNAQSCSIVVEGLGRYSWSRFITCIHAECACEPVAKWPIMGHLRYNNNSNNYMSEHLGSQANLINIYFFCTKMVFGERYLGRRVSCILLCTIE